MSHAPDLTTRRISFRPSCETSRPAGVNTTRKRVGSRRMIPYGKGEAGIPGQMNRSMACPVPRSRSELPSRNNSRESGRTKYSTMSQGNEIYCLREKSIALWRGWLCAPYPQFSAEKPNLSISPPIRASQGRFFYLLAAYHGLPADSYFTLRLKSEVRCSYASLRPPAFCVCVRNISISTATLS